jgi:hypothetical protein
VRSVRCADRSGAPVAEVRSLFAKGCCSLKFSTHPDDMPDGQRQIIAEINL